MNGNIFNQKPEETTNTVDENLNSGAENIASNNVTTVNNSSETIKLNVSSPQGLTTPSGQPLSQTTENIEQKDLKEEATPVIKQSAENVSNKQDKRFALEDEKYLKAYIGRNYNKIKNRKFNLSAFVFSIPYLFYRKRYFLGFFLIVLIIALLYFASQYLSNLVMWQILAIVVGVLFVLMLILGLTFNKTYFQRAINKVSDYKEMYKNNDDILIACTKKGRTSLSRVFSIILFPLFILLILLIFLVFKTTDKSVLNTFVGEVKENVTSELENIFYNVSSDSVVNYGDVGEVYNVFNISVPSYFEKQGASYIYDSGPLENDACTFKFNIVKDYSNSNDLIKKLGGNAETSEINNVTWYNITANNNLMYYGITEKDGKVYLAEFQIGGSVENPEVCQNHYNEIMSSISYK